MEYIHFIGLNNALVRPADPIMLGIAVEQQSEILLKTFKNDEIGAENTKYLGNEGDMIRVSSIKLNPNYLRSI